MPNHVTNNLKILDLAGADLAQVHATFLNDARQVDFNVISKMPEDLADFVTHNGIISRAKMALGLLPNPKELGEGDFLEKLDVINALNSASAPVDKNDIGNIIRAISNYKHFGFMNWEDWAYDNWGTKWNAYSQKHESFGEDAIEFEFQTAWSHPFALIKKISEINPGVTFGVQYADEDIGSNCGTYKIKDGEMTEKHITPHYMDQSAAERKEFDLKAYRSH